MNVPCVTVCDFLQISINGQVHNVGTVVRVSNHYMVGIVLGILAALVAGAVLAFAVMKHLRKKKKGIGLQTCLSNLYYVAVAEKL